MMEEKDDILKEKKVWTKPTVIHLPVKNTKGGGVNVDPEDTTYNPEGS